MSEIIVGNNGAAVCGLGCSSATVWGSGTNLSGATTFGGVTNLVSTNITLLAPGGPGSGRILVMGGMSVSCNSPSGGILYQYAYNGSSYANTSMFGNSQDNVPQWQGDWNFLWAGFSAGTVNIGLAAYDANVICCFVAGCHAYITCVEIP